jgi:hypothetical protein
MGRKDGQRSAYNGPTTSQSSSFLIPALIPNRSLSLEDPISEPSRESLNQPRWNSDPRLLDGVQIYARRERYQLILKILRSLLQYRRGDIEIQIPCHDSNHLRAFARVQKCADVSTSTEPSMNGRSWSLLADYLGLLSWHNRCR